MKARVVFSNIGYKGINGDRRLSAKCGQVITLSDEEFDRLDALGAVTRFAGGGTSELSGPTPPHPALVKRTGTRATKPKA